MSDYDFRALRHSVLYPKYDTNTPLFQPGELHTVMNSRLEACNLTPVANTERWVDVESRAGIVPDYMITVASRLNSRRHRRDGTDLGPVKKRC